MLHRILLTSAFLFSAACATDDGAAAGPTDDDGATPSEAGSAGDGDEGTTDPAPTTEESPAPLLGMSGGAVYTEGPRPGAPTLEAPKNALLEALSLEERTRLHEEAKPQGAAVADPHADVYNRVITLLANPSDDNEAVKAAAKKATGAEVASLSRLSVRKGEKVYVLVRFAPASPPRGAAEQATLVEKLRASEAFAAADPDKIMTMKAD